MRFYLFLIAVGFSLTMADDTEIKNILEAGNNKFTGKMLSKVVQENPGKSTVLSAFSVITPLAQLALASEGTTHDELLNAIGFPNDNSIIPVFSLINKKIRSIQGIELKMANRIYIPLNYELNDNFASISNNIFKSEVKNADFGKKIQTAAEINHWVRVQTNDRIKQLIKPSILNDSVRAILINVLYFKGTWKNKFDKTKTAKRNFYINKEYHIEIPIMRNTATYKYGLSNNLNSKILEIPYVGGQSSMVIILPNEVDGIKALIDKLEDFSILDQEIINILEQEVDVFIPKFKVETKIDLKKLLQKMNVTKLFSLEANLNKLLKSREELFVSQAVQKSYIEVNEEGAEASSGNIMVMVLKSSLQGNPVFNANHPFLFLLRSNNITLFSGVYNG